MKGPKCHIANINNCNSNLEGSKLLSDLGEEDIKFHVSALSIASRKKPSSDKYFTLFLTCKCANCKEIS